MSLKNNVTLAYALAFLNHSWFWLGVWVFYYLRFTTYAGIGLIETVLIVTMTLAEIPTGAVADLLGKKWSLIIAFFVQGLGNILMGVAPSFLWLMGSVFVASLGGTLYSGTIEALVYDSLLSDKDEARYDRVISNMRTLQLISPAVFGLVGGWLYSLSPGLPFVASGIAYLLACVLSFWLTEPQLDTEKFSLKVFFEQNKRGIQELTKTSGIKSQVLLLLSIATIAVIVEEMLDSFLGVEFGFSETQLAFLWSFIFIISALASQATPYFSRRFSPGVSLLLIGSLIGISLAISPWLGLAVGGFTLVVRSSLLAIFGNITSLTINTFTQSKYRATTLSTFNMLKNIPYLLAAAIIGYLSDLISARTTALVLGVLLLGLLTVRFLVKNTAEDSGVTDNQSV